MNDSYAGNQPPKTTPRDFLLRILPVNSIGAEIGVHKGDFSQRILELVDPVELHLIDPWKHETSPTYEKAWYGGKALNGQSEMDERFVSVCHRFRKEISENRVKIHRATSAEILDKFPDDYFDWIYIDGNHLYPFVRADLETSFRKVKRGGFVTGDDYDEGGWWDGGIKKAVDEFIERKSADLVLIKARQYVFRRSN